MKFSRYLFVLLSLTLCPSAFAQGWSPGQVAEEEPFSEPAVEPAPKQRQGTRLPSTPTKVRERKKNKQEARPFYVPSTPYRRSKTVDYTLPKNSDEYEEHSYFATFVNVHAFLGSRINGSATELGIKFLDTSVQWVFSGLFEGSGPKVGQPSGFFVGLNGPIYGIPLSHNMNPKLSITMPTFQISAGSRFNYSTDEWEPMFKYAIPILGVSLAGNVPFNYYIGLRPLSFSVWQFYSPFLDEMAFNGSADFNFELGVNW